jgi:hypothetical protein
MADFSTTRDSSRLDVEKQTSYEPTSDLEAATIVAEPESEPGTSDGPKDEVAAESDPNIVDWDGPADPENPMNWPDKRKWLNIAVLSILTLVT